MRKLGHRKVLFNLSLCCRWEIRVIYQDADGFYIKTRHGHKQVKRLYRDSERTRKLRVSNKFYYDGVA